MMTEHPGVAAGLDSWLGCQHVPASALREGSGHSKDSIYAPGGHTMVCQGGGLQM